MSTSSASSATPGVYSSDIVAERSSKEPAPRSKPRDSHPHRASARTRHGASEPVADGGSTGEHNEAISGELDEAISGELNESQSALPLDGHLGGGPGTLDVAATSSVSAEAQQGDGPAAAGASASGVGRGIARTSVVSVVIGPDGAAAACEAGAVVAGPHGAAAASEAGVAAVGQNGAASSSNAANATSAAVDGAGEQGSYGDLLARLARLEEESRALRSRLQ